jgi:uncharacterized protein YuzE
MIELKHDYDKELDILHVYNSNIDKGIKGCLTYPNFNIDVGQDDKIVGVEVEGASSILNLSPEILVDLDGVDLIVRKNGNGLFIGVGVVKAGQRSMIQVTPSLQQESAIFVFN